MVLIYPLLDDYYGTYHAMEELFKDRKIKVIGVSNFYPDRLVNLLNFNEVISSVNQVEIHVFNQQNKAIEIMKKYGVQPQAWATFAEGRMIYLTMKY